MPVVWGLYNEELTFPKRSLAFILSPWEMISRPWNVLPHREYPCLPKGFGHPLSNNVIYDEGFETRLLSFSTSRGTKDERYYPELSGGAIKLKVRHMSNTYDQVLIKTLNLWTLKAHVSFPVHVTHRGQEEITQSRSAQGKDDRSFMFRTLTDVTLCTSSIS